MSLDPANLPTKCPSEVSDLVAKIDREWREKHDGAPLFIRDDGPPRFEECRPLWG